ncbi:heavy metal-associated isoprenylated plant protein 16-like [Magnolia sinica]|uniref:heavy metal-associated isoprenylated plant protein 16-like n=1 Tax=Magnolia sinica TaxID=86752 RepID=UPI00265A9DA9|nr:heavy metal-associated isoprenylated plant protein 16-like [Magnolia sinica]
MVGKQKVVMKVPVNDEKSRSRALRTAVGVPGCISVSIEGKDKDMVVVIGDGIDSVVLTKSLRKKLGGAELITVTPVDEKKAQEKKPEEKPKKPEEKPKKQDNQPAVFPALQQPIIYVHPYSPYYNPDPCAIM